MGATIYDNERSENHQKKSSCNSFLDRAFVDDVPAMRQPQYSRSYCSNRFSSYAFVLMVAVYLLLPFDCMAIATETNQTSAILTSPPEALISPTRQDIDNEISATLEENPISIEKENFLKSPLTENLEDTIRSSVKSEIEQNVGSPALLNALNVMPETENIVLVEYPGATTSAPKHELPIAPNAEATKNTQCDVSSLVCLRPNKKELQSSTAVNIIENIAATTVVPAIENLSTTTVVPITVEATDLPQTAEQNVREGRTLESESISQNAAEDLIIESVNSKVPATLQPEKPSFNNDQNIDSKPLNKENISKIETDETEKLKDSENAFSNINQNAAMTISHLLTVETEVKSDSIEPVAAPLLNETNEDEIIASKNPIDSLNSLSKTNDNQSEIDQKPKNPSESSIVNAINKTVNEKHALQTSTPQNEVETQQSSEIIAESKPSPETETESVPNEPVVQSSESKVLTVENVNLNHKNSEIIESQEIASEVQNAPTDHNQETEINNPQTTIRTNIEVLKNEIQSVPLDSEQTNETSKSLIESNNNIISQEISVPTTPSSEPSVVQHNNINLENETLSIIFEEPLTATEFPIPQDDDYIKTIIEMEDPLLGEAIIDQTTVQPEQLVHNVIKKQGVEPIDVEEPIDIADLEPEGTTVQPSLNNLTSEEKTVQLVSETVEGSRTPAVTNDIESKPKISTDLPIEKIAQDITEVSVVFPGKGDDDVSLNGKGSRSINALHSPLTDNHKASIHFDVYPAGQTFNGNLAEELPNGIGKALPNHRLNEQSANRSTLIIALCSGTAILFIVISVAIFMVSFQRQHGTLDIEMQERRDNIHDEETETCVKLLDIELPNTSLALQTDAEAEIEECL